MAARNVAGVRLWVECAGSGAATLILVHGLACDHEDWRAQVDALSSRFRVVTFDLPHHGRSGAGQGDIAALGALVSALRSSFEGPVFLGGHSLGCLVVLEALRQDPTDIAGLIFLDGGRLAHEAPEATHANIRQRLDAVGAHAFLRAIYENMFEPGRNDALRREALARIERLDLQAAEAMILDAVFWDGHQAPLALARVQVPVLLLQSTYLDENHICRSLQPGMTTPWTQLVTGQVPQARTVIVPDTGHFLMVDAAAIVSEQIGAFIADVIACSHQRRDRQSFETVSMRGRR